MMNALALSGGAVGILVALVTQLPGGDALFWTVVLGAERGVVDRILDRPDRPIAYRQRLER